MGSFQVFKEADDDELKPEIHECTADGSLDFHGQPAVRERTGRWVAGAIILLNQGLATLAFFGVGVNLVQFLTRVMQQDNVDAANSVSKWMGTVYLFSLVGAFLSDAYWGRYKTCAVFQVIFVIGLALFSLTTQIFLLKPGGCGDKMNRWKSHSSQEMGLFYISIYTVALGNGGYQPNIATFGADQFDEEDPTESHSKVAFFSYFYLLWNLGSLFSNTVIGYFEDGGMWALGLWASTSSAFAALVLFLIGTKRYRHFKPSGNPLSRFSQVIVAASRKQMVKTPPGEERSLDRAAILTSQDLDELRRNKRNPWRLCPISQVEEVKCILRLLPIWLCTIMYSVLFTQMDSLFVEQGNAMNNVISNFRIPAASMSTFDILSVAVFIFLCRRVLEPLTGRIRKSKTTGLTELQRMGIGLVIAITAMLSAGIVECYRLKYAWQDCKHCRGSSTLSIFWQVPQYVLIGVSEVFMYIGQLEFFNAQTPDGLKTFGSSLCMTSMSLGNYISSLLVSTVMKVSMVDNRPGWIPGNLNEGHLDRFYFLLAGLTTIDLIVYIACALWYKSTKVGGTCEEGNTNR